MMMMKTEKKNYATCPERLNKSLHVINQIKLLITKKYLSSEHRDESAFRLFIKV